MATAITPWLKSINESTCTLKSLLSRNSLERWKSTKNVRARFPNLLHLLYFHQLRPLQLPPSVSSVYPLSPPPLSSLHGSRPYAFRPPMSSMTTTDASSSPSTNKTVRVSIKGKVQGVFYRDWTIENANQLRLKGWVRNRRDGSVEALFSGNADSVQEMEQRCRRGPQAAIVTGVEVFPCSDDPGQGFVRKPTA